jgi:hypothetical protein
MVRNIIAASLIVTITVSSYTSERTYLKRARIARTVSAIRVEIGTCAHLINDLLLGRNTKEVS